MKKKYFDRLSEELDKVNAKHKDDIIDKYKKRYDFGLESGMKEAEIEEMLGDPAEIAKKYAGDNPYTTDGFNKNYNLSIKTVSDDIVIKKTKDDKVHVYFDDCEEDKLMFKLYNINRNTITNEPRRQKQNHIGCHHPPLHGPGCRCMPLLRLRPARPAHSRRGCRGEPRQQRLRSR